MTQPVARLARFPFLLVLIGIFGLGMAGLLMLNTTLQSQAFQSRTLNRQATELAYAQADLKNQLDALAAPQELARRASALGMRPNPFPAFLVLPSGKVVGEPTPVSGSEMPSSIVKTPAQLAARRRPSVRVLRRRLPPGPRKGGRRGRGRAESYRAGGGEAEGHSGRLDNKEGHGRQGTAVMDEEHRPHPQERRARSRPLRTPTPDGHSRPTATNGSSTLHARGVRILVTARCTSLGRG